MSWTREGMAPSTPQIRTRNGPYYAATDDRGYKVIRSGYGNVPSKVIARGLGIQAAAAVSAELNQAWSEDPSSL